MTGFVVSLPMYDFADITAQTDARWSAIRDRLLANGVAAPERLTRRNADMPAVPGGIRDAAGALIAPDPATLPPDSLDLPTLWRHPRLLLAQTCWGPMEFGLSNHVVVVGQQDYSGIEGGAGEKYSSAVLMRGAASPAMYAVPPPADGAASLPLELLRGRRLAFNGPDSMSGIIGLSRDLKAAGEDLSLFSDRIETGSHRNSVLAVAEGRADVCAVDCMTWHLCCRFEPAAARLAVVGWTARRKGLPYVTAGRLAELAPAVRSAVTPS